LEAKLGVLWITGLSGSGKTTLAKKIVEIDKVNDWIHLDGDQLRQILSSGNLYDRHSRLTLSKQYSKIAKVISDQNYNVIVSTISLFKEIHELNRSSINQYFEVYINCRMELLQERDDKSLYASKKSKNLIGLDINYDEPVNPDYTIEQDFDVKKIEIYAKSVLKQITWIN
jgi:adenylylsulfate kinase